MTAPPIYLPPEWGGRYDRRVGALFAFRANDGIDNPLAGNPLVPTRNYEARWWGINGYIGRVGNNVARYVSVDADGDQVAERVALRLDAGSTNYVRSNNDLTNATYWTATNAPTIGATIELGEVTLQEMIDDSGALLESFEQTLSVPGSVSLPTLSFFVARGFGAQAGGGGSVRLRNTTDATNIGYATITFASATAAPVVTPTAGTTIGVEFHADVQTKFGNVRVWRVQVLSGALFNAAKAYTLRVVASDVAAQTGTMLFGGFQIDVDMGSATQPLRGEGAVFGTSPGGEFYTTTIDWRHVGGRAVTLYLDCLAARGMHQSGADGDLFGLLDGAGSTILLIGNGFTSLGGGNTNYRAKAWSTLQETLVPVPAHMQRTRIRAVLTSDAKVYIGVQAGTGAEAVSAIGTAFHPAAIVAPLTLTLQSPTASTLNVLGAAVLLGERSMAECDAVVGA